jgi:hypothetical protein
LQPLRILQQNTGLIAIAHRGWMPRKSVVRKLIAELKHGNWDVVALSEVFRHSERDLIVEGLREVLPHKIYGPDASTFPPRFSGGLLLLSRFPLTRPRFYVCRNSSGVDSWCNKGMLLAHIRPQTLSSDLVLGLCHTQNPDAAGLESVRDITARQLEELGRFVEFETSADDSVLLMGDFNTDFHERACKHTYPHMMMQFKGFEDLWNKYGMRDDPGITFDDHCTFRHGNHLEFDSAARFKQGQRLDYFLYRQGTKYNLLFDKVEVDIPVYEPGFALSDHYGLSLDIKKVEIN